MSRRRIKIRSTGHYLPRKKVESTQLDERLNLPGGTIESLSGVRTRYHVDGTEFNSDMAAVAAMQALENAQLTFKDIDVMVYASGSYEQPLPCQAALVQKRLGQETSGVPCFDIDSTCLSFVTALDHLSWPLMAGHYKRALIVSGETSSVALNWKHPESCALFGDGAAAAVVEITPESESSHIFGSLMATYSSGLDYCQIEGGGSRIHPRHYREDDPRFTFSMDGRHAFRGVRAHMPDFLAKLLGPSGMKIQDFDMIIPHQASLSAMDLMFKYLEVDPAKVMMTLPDYGNMVAASIPFALHEAARQKRIKRGDKLLLLGTSAGFSLGAIALEY